MFNNSNSILYAGVVRDELANNDMGLFYLSYLKVRIVAKLKAGTFTYGDFLKQTELSPQTAKKHINALIEKGYIIHLQGDTYRIVRQHTLNENKLRNFYILMPDEKVKKYSWRNLSEFRADLTEIVIEANRREKKLNAGRKRRVVDLRDNTVSWVENGSIIDQKKYHNFVALKYGKILTGLPQSTLSKYRKRTSLSNYTWKMYKLWKDEHSINNSKIRGLLKFLIGQPVEYNDCVYISPVSKRESFINLRVFCPRKPKSARVESKRSIIDVTQTCNKELELINVPF